MNCPRCGTPMQGGVCPECGFPVNWLRIEKKKNDVKNAVKVRQRKLI